MGAPVVYTNLKQVIGNHLLFLREGTTVAANANAIGGAVAAGGNVSAQLKPGIGVLEGETQALPVWPQADPNWAWLGIAEDLDPQNKPMEEDLVGPLPQGGGYGRLDVIGAGGTLDIVAKLQTQNQATWESIMMAFSQIVSGTAYLPASGNGLLRGWLKIVQYGNGAAPVNVVDLYVSMSVKTGAMNNKAVKPTITAKAIYSALASGMLTWA